MNQREDFNRLLNEIVDSVLQSNEDMIATELSRGIDWNEDSTITTLRLINHSLRLATNISVQTVFTILLDAGIISLNEEPLKPTLQIIRGDLDSPRE